VLGAAPAKDLAARLWSLEAIDDVASLVESIPKPA
jgi:hypothetical protein